MTIPDLIKLLVAGAIVGLATYALFLALDQFVFTPALCNSAGLEERCANKASFASGIALIIGAFIGLFAAVQQRVYRPLLVVIFATLGLWTVPLIAASLPWWGASLIVAVLFACAYGAFAWVVQLRNIYAAVGLAIALLVVLRLVISA